MFFATSLQKVQSKIVVDILQSDTRSTITQIGMNMQYDASRAMLFETSWEVCNKVGGIYAVVSSKALEAVDRFGENYFLFGPDLGNNAEFEETDEHGWELIRQVMALRNLKCRFGRWNIPGRPKVILVNFRDRYNTNQLLYELWNRYGVDSLSGGFDYVEPVMFSTACGEAIAAIYQTLAEPADSPAFAQFHEWMCGAGLLTVKRIAPKIGTIFTTHATMLGRSMAGSGFDIYKQMRQINPEREAVSYNIMAKCSMERTSAREADCFTTVSAITADEAAAFLGRAPDVVTPNGLDMRVIPDYSAERFLPETRRADILKTASRFLRRELPDDTRIVIISGRYEFHNKGVDAFLDALSGVNQALNDSKTHVLALVAVMGGHSGVNLDAVSGSPERMPAQGGNWIATHHVYDQPNDLILNACTRLGLDNRPENHVQVIFNPALLDGHDGFFNMPYDEVLSACDLGVFPSWYEPWGYTPQESAAHSVPTVTTDLSGFGMWAKDIQDKLGINGATILARRQTGYEDTVAALRGVLLNFASCPADVLLERRVQARALSNECSWKRFFPYYLQAFSVALDKAADRGALRDNACSCETLSRVFASTPSSTPMLRGFTAVPQLPVSIKRLRELAYNLWWAWHPESWELFTALDPEAWEKNAHNPVLMIERASSSKLLALAHDETYLSRYNTVIKAFDEYMAAISPHLSPELNHERPVAYFSTEYGINECLPIYSGGLGVLSGDHLKSASDLNLPLVGVGLLYKNGYFQQQIDDTGRQVALYPENDFSLLPLERVKDEKDDPLDIELELPGRKLFAQVWRVRVGRVSLYLLDTDTPKNTDADRRITARLYEADRDCRLRQEILLGMGGVRLLRALAITPAVWHMNEGHSAFLILERIRTLITDFGMSFDAAKELVAGSCLFTTHTPVDAGNERFTLELMEHYFMSYAQSVGISWSDFLQMGRIDGDSRNLFEMTVLALKHSFKANGVSRLHGYVSRRMWREVWRGVPPAEVPIGYVTNGVHVPSYAGPDMKQLLDRHLGEGWMEQPPTSLVWSKITDIPMEELWSAKLKQKTRLLSALRASLPEMFQKFNIDRDTRKAVMAKLEPSALIIGFARRFAPYKRATLLFADPERLARILGDSTRPVIFIFAGKAHPADEQGIDLMQEVIRYTNDPRFAGKIFFLENYNLAVSRCMVQGCDVWLNTPRRPYEASGTSGQKTPVNAGLNLSVSDGWWCEGYNGDNGWTIGPVVDEPWPDENQSDYQDAESLYSLLEDQVLPLYFERRDNGIPHEWLKLAKNSMQSLTAQFSSNRMVTDYFERCYLPGAARHAELILNNMPQKLAEWKKDVAGRFPSLRIERLRVDGVAQDILCCNRAMRVEAFIQPGTMKKDELLVQLVAGPHNGTYFIGSPDCINLNNVRVEEDGTLVYAGSYSPTRNGYHAYGVRVMPVTEGLASPLETGLVLWG